MLKNLENANVFGVFCFYRLLRLIIVLFMASFVFPMLLPQGMRLDVLTRVGLGLTLFQAAYMAEVVRGMLRDALDAFVRRDTALAKKVLERDDVVDAKNLSLIRELLTYMAENPALISRSIEIMLISRNLERVADLAPRGAPPTSRIGRCRCTTTRCRSRASSS